MPDFRVVHLRKFLPVSRMLDVPGPPHYLLITGPEASAVSAVEINGQRGYPWTAVDARTISVQLPDVFLVRSVAVLGPEMGTVKEAEVFLGFTTLVSRVSGLQRLVQDWLKCFLTTPRSDPFNPVGGGGAQRIIQNKTQAEGSLNSGMSIAVKRTNEQMTSRQAADITIPRAERLLDAKLRGTQFILDQEGYIVDIEITSMTGAKAGVGVSSNYP